MIFSNKICEKLPGNGIFRMSVDTALSDIIIGDNEYFRYAFVMKYTEREATMKNMMPKKILKSTIHELLYTTRHYHGLSYTSVHSAHATINRHNFYMY